MVRIAGIRCMGLEDAEEEEDKVIVDGHCPAVSAANVPCSGADDALKEMLCIC